MFYDSEFNIFYSKEFVQSYVVALNDYIQNLHQEEQFQGLCWYTMVHINMQQNFSFCEELTYNFWFSVEDQNLSEEIPSYVQNVLSEFRLEKYNTGRTPERVNVAIILRDWLTEVLNKGTL